MRFFNEGSAGPEKYREAIEYMEKETDFNYRKRELMKKIMFIGLLVFIFSIIETLFFSQLIGFSGMAISLIAIFISNKKKISFHMCFCFACYSHNMLQEELTQLYTRKKTE